MESRSRGEGKTESDLGKEQRPIERILCPLISAALLLLLLIAVLQACQSSGTGTSADTEITVYKTGYCFDTVITLTAYTSRMESETASQILEDALLLCQEYEAKYLDRFGEESEIGAINATQRQIFSENIEAGYEISDDEIVESPEDQTESNNDTDDEAVQKNDKEHSIELKTGTETGYTYEVSDICRDLIEVGLYYYELSNGSFDLTVTPLSDLWNVTDEDFTVPTSEQVAEAKSLVGSDRVTLSGNTLTLGEGQQLNFGGIAKGYMCEVLRQYFTENGLSHVIVNLGGNVFVMGGEEGYTVAVANPLSEDYAAAVFISDGYVVTSGIYERGQEVDGVWYHHIIDPATGYPVDTEIVSATVVMDISDHPDSAVAWHSDVLSTMFVLTKTQEGAYALWQQLKADEKYEELSQVILVLEDGTVTVWNESDQ
ncbi:MAG: FAD:protein FMN transferase [Lachnospiraceae bacterium]|nr:FAD:protein FMN transferase [Lachnospiraceae bacterium]